MALLRSHYRLTADKREIKDFLKSRQEEICSGENQYWFFEGKTNECLYLPRTGQFDVS